MALARLRVASVQEKTRQEADGTGGPLKIDTGVQPSPWGAIPMQMNCTDAGSAQRKGLIFSKVSVALRREPGLVNKILLD